MGKRAKAWNAMMAEVSAGRSYTITEEASGHVQTVAIVVPFEAWQKLKRDLANAEERLETGNTLVKERDDEGRLWVYLPENPQERILVQDPKLETQAEADARDSALKEPRSPT